MITSKRTTYAVAAILGISTVIGATALVLLSYTSGARIDATYRPKVEEMFGGADGLAVISDPERVEAYRLGPLRDRVSLYEARPSDFPTTAGPMSVSQFQVEQVSAALLSPRSYYWEKAKGCKPTFGVMLSFRRGADRIDVLLCLSCDILLVARNDLVTGGEDFDWIRPVIVRAVKEAFPDDSLIQSLNEKRGGPKGI